MAVRPPSKRKTKEKSVSSADKWIEKGGSTTKKSKAEEKVRPKLYVTRGLMDRVDEARTPPHRSVTVSQNQWIMEAIIEKLKREGLPPI